MTQARNLCFTLNNYTEEELTEVHNWECKYLIVGEEIGEQGTPHLQGYIEFATPKRITALKKLNNRVHWEARKGTSLQASNYCKKEGKFFEKGTRSQQGCRTDLDEIKKEITEGKSVDQIVMETPMVYHQYGRTLHKIEDITLRNKYRTWMTKGLWLWGPTGVGKSHRAFQGFHPSTHYVVPDDGGWWDGYTGQETVILNDFRGSIPYSQLLQIVDQYPYGVRRRGREPAPLLARWVIVTSSMRPEDVYHNLAANDKLEQLYRRFEVVELDNTSATEVVRGNTNPDLCNNMNL